MVTTPAAVQDPKRVKLSAMIKPLIIMLLMVTVVLGGIFGWQAFMGSMMKSYMASVVAAPQTVSTVSAVKTTWQARIEAVGTLRAVHGADISAQVSGVVDRIEFDSGNEVSAGQVLLRLKPNDDIARLRQLQAAAKFAGQAYKRDQDQFAAQAISQATLEADVSNLKTARAQVTAQRALIEEKIVKAPFAGRLGIRQVDLGQYLGAGTAVVTLQALDPMLIDFYVPQQALAHLRTGQLASTTVDTFPGVSFRGAIESINSKVDAASRNIQVRALFPNPHKRLLPGMFANVAIELGDATSEVTLPQSAITFNPYGDTVYVVEHGGLNGAPAATVHQRFVKLGTTRGDQVAILSGVKEGDMVVSAGQLKLRNGAAVVVNNSIQPTDDSSPRPPNE